MELGTQTSTWRPNLRLVLVLVGTLVGVGLVTQFLFAWFGVFVLVAGLSALGYRQYRAGKYLTALLIAAFLVRAAIILVNAQLHVLSQPPISVEHSANAAALADLWTQGEFLDGPTIPSRTRRFVAYVLAPFYVLLGSWEVAGELAIAGFGTLIGYVAYELAAEVTTHRNAVLAAGIVVFWPSILYRSVVIQREVIVALTMLTMLWIALQWTDRERPRNWVQAWPWLRDVAALALIAVVIYLARRENVAIIAVTFAAAIALRYRRSPRSIGLVGLLLVPLFAYLALNIGKLTGVGTAISPRILDRYAQGRNKGATTYLTDLHYESWFDVLLYLPIKVFYYLFSPMPWQVNGVADLLAGVSGWAMAVAVLVAVPGFFWARGDVAKRFTMLAYAASGIAAYAIIELNAGAAFRRRIQFVPVILVFAAIGFGTLFARLDDRRSSTTDPTPLDSENTNPSDVD
ncbi:hypothetical protein [Halococcus agarilyticus]|uniref:hypothetical protein n=1 Tax=Halococcus agarilyticus TaxID=1232219 RepID=UPI000677C5A7|nr:hypothetical protein [Halococcus agarilyticus]